MGLKSGEWRWQIKQLRAPAFDQRTHGRDFVGGQVVEDHDASRSLQRRPSEHGWGIDWFAEIAVTNLPKVNQVRI